MDIRMNMFNNNKILVVIPAKGVSKGIPRKYVRLLNNKPLIYYAINIAKSSQYVDDVVVTTDDSEIASISEKFGVSVIRRSKELSGEDIPLDAVVFNAMVQKEKSAFDEYDIVITMLPTSPLLKTQTLDNAIEKFDDFSLESVISVVEDKQLFWGYDDDNKIYFPKYIERCNRKDLPSSFRETGAIIATRRGFINEISCIGENIDVIELSDEEAITVDDFKDWWVVETILQRKRIGIVVNANNEIGTRRIDNCLAFASKLVSHEFLFILDEKHKLGQNLVEKFGFNFKIYNGHDAIYNILEEFAPQIIINDVSDTTEEYMSDLKEKGYFVANFDVGVGSNLADVVFDSLYEHDLSDTNVYTGQKFHILKDEFYFQPHKVITQDVDNILIMVDGNDPKHLSEKFLEAILSTTYEMKINIIVGRGYENIEQFISNYESNPLVQIYQNVPNVSDFMFKADILVTSASKIMYDACALGVPTICVYQNDLETSHVFANSANGILNLGDVESLTKQEFVNQFLELVNNHDLRLNMHNKMKSIDLQHGYENICAVVTEEYRKFAMNK
ncbi:cytidylyltransferase domain-containing protein [Methanobrevibacter gottschalkii]|uniref:cytidylyltransferase domain-containing protein n=1 Tax=Methanobrevibacter gottschalkii TaxID=190974 RepID=UPI0038D0060F